MKPNTLFVGKNIIERAEVPSTNSFAMQCLAEVLLPEGTAILAHAQTQGRGQRGNYWESAPGLNFTGSFVLYPRFLAAGEQFRLNIAVSLAVCYTLRILLPERTVKIKWPNDIYVNDKKIAGILIENTLKGSNLEHAVIGIGVNINQIAYNSAAPNPTSLKGETGRDYLIADCFELLCSQLEAQYLRLKGNTGEELYRDYIENLYRFQAWHQYMVNGLSVLGRITGIDETGHLLITLEDGALKRYDLKEVRFVI